MSLGLRIIFLSLVASVVSIPPASAQGECSDYSRQIRTVGLSMFGETGIGESVHDIELRDSWGFVAEAINDGLIVYDLGDVTNPTPVATVPDLGGIGGIELSGNRAYGLANPRTAVTIYDISDPVTPVPLMRIETDEPVTNIAVAGTGLYIEQNYTETLVMDVEDPTHPIQVGKLDFALGRYLESPTVRDGAMYMVHEGNLRILDVTRPLAPVVASDTAVPAGHGTLRALTVAGSYLFATAEGPTFQVWDVSDIFAPAFITEIPLDTRGIPDRLRASDSGVIFTGGGTGFGEVDVSDPEHPRFVFAREGTDFPFVILTPDLVCRAIGMGVAVVDLGDRTTTEPLGTLETSGYVYSLASLGNDSGICLAGADDELLAVDHRDPRHPEVVGSLDLPEKIQQIEIVGDVAHCRCFENLVTVDVEDPAGPTLLGSVSVPGSARDMRATEDYNYVIGSHFDGDSWTGDVLLWILDVKDPVSPRIVSETRLGEGQWTTSEYLAYQPGFVYGAISGPPRLVVVDVRDPTTPTVVAEFPYAGHGEAMALHVLGSHLYAASNFLDIFDISVPTSPVLVNSLYAAGGYPVYCSGNLMYAFYGGFSFTVLDATEPDAPIPLGGFAVPNWSTSTSAAAVSGSHILLGGRSHILIAPRDCSDPFFSSPDTCLIDVKPGSDDDVIDCYSRGVVPVAILSTADFDAMMVDHTTVRFGPGQAAEAHVNGRGPVRHEEDVDADGDLDLVFHFRSADACIGCDDTEVTLTGRMVDGRPIIGTSSIRTNPGAGRGGRIKPDLAVTPNPFNPQTSITFSVEAPRHVLVAVYDMRGRLMVDLVDQQFIAGRHSVTWSGRDSAGRSVPSGEYVIRVEVEGQIETRKVMLVR